MKQISILLVSFILFLTGCASSKVTLEKDSFTGTMVKKAVLHNFPDLNSVVNVELSRDPGDANGKASMKVTANYYGFRFQSGKAFGIKADDQLFWFERKAGVNEVVQQLQGANQEASTAEFEPVDLAVLKKIAAAKVVTYRVVGLHKTIDAKYSAADIKVLLDFTK